MLGQFIKLDLKLVFETYQRGEISKICYSHSKEMQRGLKRGLSLLT